MAIDTPSDRTIVRSKLAVAAGVTGFVVDALYIWLIVAQGESNAGRVGAVSILVAAFSLLAIVGGLASRLSTRVRLGVLGAASGGLLTAGVLGIFSIGLPLLVAGVLGCAAWASVARAAQPVPNGAPTLSLVAAIAAGTVLVLGIGLT